MPHLIAPVRNVASFFCTANKCVRLEAFQTSGTVLGGSHPERCLDMEVVLAIALEGCGTRGIET